MSSNEYQTGLVEHNAKEYTVCVLDIPVVGSCKQICVKPSLDYFEIFQEEIHRFRELRYAELDFFYEGGRRHLVFHFFVLFSCENQDEALVLRELLIFFAFDFSRRFVCEMQIRKAP